MAKKVKVGPLVVLVLILAAALTLVLTNPGDKDFQDWKAKQGAAATQRNIGGTAGKILGSVSGALESGKALTYTRKNLFVASLYTPSKLLEGKTYIGLLKKVFIGF